MVLLTISKNYVLSNLQTFIVEAIPCYVFDQEEVMSANVQYLISNFMIRSKEAAIRRCSSK